MGPVRLVHAPVPDPLIHGDASLKLLLLLAIGTAIGPFYGNGEKRAPRLAVRPRNATRLSRRRLPSACKGRAAAHLERMQRLKLPRRTIPLPDADCVVAGLAIT